MSDINHACLVISEEGAHADCTKGLSDEEYAREDRNERIISAAQSLSDYVFEFFADYDQDDKRHLPFEHKHIGRIAKLAAICMEAQYRYDKKIA